MQINRIVTTDNNYLGEDLSPHILEDLSHIANCRIDQLKDSRENDLWLFPKRDKRYGDRIEDESIIQIVNNKLTTGNILGFVGYGNTQLTIRSRFTNFAGHDWFMEYMLQKVFSINIFNLQHSAGEDNALNITAMMFPYFLQKALRQGVYREYAYREYNDSRVRGVIDFNAHIKANFPFKNCKVAYITRERVYDNHTTQLIRHTIEYLKSNSVTWALLCSSQDTQNNIRQIINATPTYRKGDLSKILHANVRPKIHPYYSEYAPLQKLCLQILNRKQTSYGNNAEKMYGVLFDGAWLWEEYLDLTMHKVGFKHPKNKERQSPIHLFKEKKRYPRFPDFIHKETIADAKYKFMIRDIDMSESIDRHDMHQMISYLYVTSANKGIFISPANLTLTNPSTGKFFNDEDIVIKEDKLIISKVGELNGYGGEIIIIAVNIPNSAKNYEEFVKGMQRCEEVLLDSIKKITL